MIDVVVEDIVDDVVIVVTLALWVVEVVVFAAVVKTHERLTI